MSISQGVLAFTPDEMMTIAASRALKNDDVCFVGIGAPSAACNVARLTHAPDITLIYESGTIGTAPQVLPLSIGDGELCDTALTTVSVPEMFRYWLQGGRITVGFLGGAQIDRYGNINTTVVGDYARPTVRLPGSGGAAEIAIHARRTLVVSRLSRRAFPESVDFVTSPGHRTRAGSRKELGMPGAGPVRVVTDKGILYADADSGELVLGAVYPDVEIEEIRAGVGWPLRVRERLDRIAPPTRQELTLLREVLDPRRLYLKG